MSARKDKQAPIDLGRDSLMAVAAFRYCLGRRTYIVSDCVEWLTMNWQKFPESVRTVIKRDLESEFVKDDHAREHGDDFKPLGWDCDRAEWQKVRALWSAEGQGVQG